MCVTFVWGLGLVLSLVGWCFSIPCPLHCHCQQTAVTCSGEHKWSWPELLESLPSGTLDLKIEGGTLHLESKVHSKHSKSDHVQRNKLQYVLISGCNIVDFESEAFLLVPHLRELHFVAVNLDKDIEEDFSLIGIPGLEYLHVYNTDIQQLEDDAFKGLSELKVLNMSHNFLKGVSSSILKDLSNLETLDLSHNEIEYIHPQAFSNLTFLNFLNLESNHLVWMKPETLASTQMLKEVHLSNNPWACYCGIEWLSEFIHSAPGRIVSADKVICGSPDHLRSMPVASLDSSHLQCLPPTIEITPENSTTLLRLQDLMVQCNATGYPPPSVYWVTPRGVVAHDAHKQWISDSYLEARPKLSYAGQPSFYEAVVEALDNGVLHFQQFRYYFAGEYKCVAENPAGIAEFSFNVSITADLNAPLVMGIMYGAMSAGSILALGIMFGSVRMCAERWCCPQSGDKSLTVEVSYNEEEWEEQPSPGTEPFYPWHMPWMWSPSFSRDDSPRKCVTPAEGLEEEHAESLEQSESAANILEQLEDVRALLRHSMQRSVGRLRTGAQHMRQSSSRRLLTVREAVRETGSRKLQNIRSHSSQAMQNFRESGSRRMRNIRSSTGQYVSRVRTGVSIGMESVKSNIQSFREFCGPGDITTTISTISVTTDVDSQERSEIVKMQTFV